MTDLKAEMYQMKQNETRNSLIITSETKPGKKPTEMTVWLQIFLRRVRTLFIRAFSTDARYGLIVSLRARPISGHLSNLSQSESEKI